MPLTQPPDTNFPPTHTQTATGLRRRYHIQLSYTANRYLAVAAADVLLHGGTHPRIRLSINISSSPASSSSFTSPSSPSISFYFHPPQQRTAHTLSTNAAATTICRIELFLRHHP
ncbi:hypothetical protein Vretimale_14668 [Volvox reticuliferus]|uniref:Uncharacterized protein n=1 Tax=Volvox reticuliferus TaxID=1737510 RepID=A0A8J4LVI4_9CHLO|nr:hypothetical protein Vretifemale_15698 [Volvox reticuliferus]GIM11127.1 hypothetical protein Vretimale_14668 [Volvox reticuliferus]